MVIFFASTSCKMQSRKEQYSLEGLARDEISDDLGVTGGDLETSLVRTRNDTKGAPDLSINNC